ncbi:MAG: type II toxin-antitoxin system VapC family toxin [Xanthomonadales bacterium]|nr:type II toxin-antitoxin system VapC family toxin [Xanthomonadales bacterium]
MSNLGYLLDTNVVSELGKRTPEPRLLAWFAGVSDARLRLSVLSVGEIRRGIERLADPVGRQRLQHWLDEQLLPWLGPQLLPVTLEVAECWGQLCARAGRSLPAVDSLLAATAQVHKLTVVTRNVADFNFPGVHCINPWDASPA